MAELQITLCACALLSIWETMAARFAQHLKRLCEKLVVSSYKPYTKLCKRMIKQLLNSAFAKYRDLSVSAFGIGK